MSNQEQAKKDARIAIMLHTNENLFKKGHISKSMYENAKDKILKLA